MNKGDDPYLTFEKFTEFVRRKMPKIEEYELIAVFIGLDVKS